MLIFITPGRLLRWAPRWPCSDDAVLFDASSGDYWVLSTEGRAVIERLQVEPGIELNALLESLAPTTAHGGVLLDGLGSAGLLVAMIDGTFVPVPSHANP